MKSDTPRTDAEYWHRHSDCFPGGCDVVPAEFARQLERDLNESINVRNIAYQHHIKVANERDQLRAQLDKQVSVTLGQLATISQLRAQLSAAEKCVEVLRTHIPKPPVTNIATERSIIQQALAAYDAIKKGQK